MPDLTITDIDRMIQELASRRSEIVDATKTFTNVDPRKLTKKEITDLAWKLPELPNNLMQLITDCNGFMTGSMVYGDPATANDLDYCVDLPPHVFDPYVVGQGDNGYWEQDGFSTVYGHYHGKLVNIICFSNTKLMQAWRATTEAMSLLADTIVYNGVDLREVFSTKWRRVRVFRALCDALFTARPLREPLAIMEATTYSKCRLCGLEAINFTTKAAKDSWKETGVCERCAS